MNKNIREEMIETMALLLQSKGYAGTGMNDIVKESGAPKGSIYYYFPGGKEQLVVEAIEWTTKIVTKKIREELAIYEDPILAIKNFIIESANRFDDGIYIYGAPISVIALEQSLSSEKVRKACQNFFEEFSEEFSKKLRASGYTDEIAVKNAKTINALIQGAYVVSVSFQDSLAFRDIANKIAVILQS